MSFKLTHFARTLQFRFDARTSRGAMQTHQAYYLRLHHTEKPDLFGWGECSPLPGLSPDYSPNFSETLQQVCDRFNALEITSAPSERSKALDEELSQWPSIKFAWETAWVDYLRGGDRTIVTSAFARSEKGIRINGLIWMGDPAFMREQITKKLDQGFRCMKLKIGGLDFQQELQILEEIRKVASADELELRLDANGAFSPEDALSKLEQLSKFRIHSLEQPIKAGQSEVMQRICAQSPIAIALDEELIGVNGQDTQWQLLRQIQPQYIILKPTLVGGLRASQTWINLAESLGIGWWMTSALESNIGLNAVAKYAASVENPLPQGLGTGQLYYNNLASPLEIRGEELWYNPDATWELPA